MKSIGLETNLRVGNGSGKHELHDPPVHPSFFTQN